MKDQDLRATVESLMKLLGVTNHYWGQGAYVYFTDLRSSQYYKELIDTLVIDNFQKKDKLAFPSQDKLTLLAKELGYEWQEGGHWGKPKYLKMSRKPKGKK